MNLLNNLEHHEKLNRNKIFFVNIITLLMGFSTALLVYVNSIYFKEILETTNISWTYLISNIFIIIILFNVNRIIKLTGKANLFHLINIAKISILLSLIFIDNKIINVLALVIFMVFEALAWSTINMILESYSIDKESGKIYGFNFTLFNLGFVLAPAISTQIIENYGFKTLFLLDIIIVSIIFIIGYLKIKKIDQTNFKKISYKDILTKISSRKDIIFIFLIAFSLYLFYALMVIYTPLYLIDKGISKNQMGIIFTLMLIPFVLIQYPAGLLADKKYGEKELIFVSFIIIGSATIAFYLTKSVEVITLGIILFITRIGAALTEILQSSYFYKKIDGDDVELIAFFQTASPFAYVITPLISSLILYFFPVKSLFLFSGIISFLTLYPIYKLKDNKSTEEVS